MHLEPGPQVPAAGHCDLDQGGALRHLGEPVDAGGIGNDLVAARGDHGHGGTCDRYPGNAVTYRTADAGQPARVLVKNEVDILFANEAEIMSLYEVDEFDQALQAVRQDVGFAALTRGPKGSVVVKGDEVHVIDAVPPSQVLDTTGAGDLYAAGFLRGLTAGFGLAECGHLGSAAAAAIIGQYGARSSKPLLPLYEQVGQSG